MKFYKKMVMVTAFSLMSSSAFASVTCDRQVQGFNVDYRGMIFVDFKNTAFPGAYTDLGVMDQATVNRVYAAVTAGVVSGKKVRFVFDRDSSGGAASCTSTTATQVITGAGLTDN